MKVEEKEETEEDVQKEEVAKGHRWVSGADSGCNRCYWTTLTVSQ